MDVKDIARSTAQDIDASNGIVGAWPAFEDGFAKAITPMVLADQARGVPMPTDQASAFAYLNENRRIFAEMVQGFDDANKGMNIKINLTPTGELKDIVFESAKK